MDKFWVYATSLGVLFVITGLAIVFITKRKSVSEKRQHWLKYFIYLILVFPLLFCFAEQTYTLHILGVIGLLGLYEIQLIFPNKKRIAPHLISLLYLILLLPIFFNPLVWETVTPLYFFVVIFDGLSQIFGQLLGGPKLWRRISPNKTWSGFIFSATITSGIGYFIYGNGYGITSVLFIVLLALTGDLLASAIKRYANVKDFSQLLPGHGGILDRFDGFLFSLGIFSWIQMCMMFSPYQTI
jgi:phosphatidate cytidylyltransferase